MGGGASRPANFRGERMKSTLWIWAPVTVALLAGCNGGNRQNSDTSGASGTGTAGTGTETGTMQGGTGMMSDTAVPSGDTSASTRGMSSDTAHADAGMHGGMTRPSSGTSGASDSAKGNQTKSGVTNTKTGKSTLGKGVTRTRPDQGQPVTSKGDTVGSGPDSTAGNQ
jgi:hypothetical protein